MCNHLRYRLIASFLYQERIKMNEKIRKVLLRKLRKNYKQYMQNTVWIEMIRDGDKKVFEKLERRIRNPKLLKSFYLSNYQ